MVTTGSAGVRQAPAEGIHFDNIDGSVAYDPAQFYGQSKFALALDAKQLSRRLSVRGIAVNSAEPGRTKNTAIGRHRATTLWARLSFGMKTPARGAATQALLAASTRVAGITGEYWRDCRMAHGHPLLADQALAARLWNFSSHIIKNAGAANSRSFKVAA